MSNYEPEKSRTVTTDNNREATISPAYPEWYLQRGLRVADLMISVDKGKTSEVSMQIFNDNRNIVFVTGRINTNANAIAQVYYTDSVMLRDTIESIRSIPYVTRVEFAEVVEIYGRKSDKQIEEDSTKLLNSSGRNR